MPNTMPTKNNGFRLTPAALDDLRDIARYTQNKWGKKKRSVYLKALDLTTSSSPAGNTGIIIYLNTRIGCIYFNEKNYSQAIEYLEMAEKASPQNVETVYYLGLSYDKIGEIEKAREFLSQVIELAPQSEFAQEAEKKLKKMDK